MHSQICILEMKTRRKFIQYARCRGVLATLTMVGAMMFVLSSPGHFGGFRASGRQEPHPAALGQSMLAAVGAEKVWPASQAGGLRIEESCQPTHAHLLAQRFRDIVDTLSARRETGWTSCSDSSYVDELHKLSPIGRKIFIDIGCNKGYTSAKFFGLWAPELGMSPKSIKERRPELDCGECGDCHEEVQSSINASSGAVNVFCFEPNQRNFAQLVLTRDAFFTNNTPDVQWFTINKAVSGANGRVQFSRECSNEMCSLSAVAQRNWDIVDSITVDTFLQESNLSYVDVLKIDTEGYDATVLEGAMESIAGGHIGIVQFEYHGIGVWKSYQLENIVRWFSNLNYVCYFDGRGSPAFARLTGCWDGLYEFWDWSNIVCVPRTHPLYSFMEEDSLRYSEFRDVYYKEVGEED